MIISVPKDTFTSEQKEEIIKKGYIVIECDDPEKIRLINPEQNMDTNDWFMAALYSCTVSTAVSKAEMFVNELYRRLKEKERINNI